jgi:hypothetical protein
MSSSSNQRTSGNMVQTAYGRVGFEKNFSSESFNKLLCSDRDISKVVNPAARSIGLNWCYSKRNRIYSFWSSESDAFTGPCACGNDVGCVTSSEGSTHIVSFYWLQFFLRPHYSDSLV